MCQSVNVSTKVKIPKTKERDARGSMITVQNAEGSQVDAQCRLAYIFIFSLNLLKLGWSPHSTWLDHATGRRLNLNAELPVAQRPLLTRGVVCQVSYYILVVSLLRTVRGINNANTVLKATSTLSSRSFFCDSPYIFF